MRVLTRLALVPLLGVATAPFGPLGAAAVAMPPRASVHVVRVGAASTDPGPPGPGSQVPGRAAYVLPVGPPLVVLRAFRPPPSDAPWLAGHRGVDLAAPAGSPVRAAAAGTVTFAGPLAGRGVVAVTAGALRWTYEPLRPSVRAGDDVVAGATIGQLAAATGHCGARSCLHWGLLRAREYLDPLAPLGPLGGHVRLLPLANGSSVEPLRVPARSGTAANQTIGESTAAVVGGRPGAGPPGSRSTGLVVGLAAAGTVGLAAAGAAFGRSWTVRRRSGLAPRGP